MLHCKTVEILYDALPFDAWRAFLIRRHVDGCPACMKRLLSLEAARSLLVGPMELEGWSGLRLRLRGQSVNKAAAGDVAGKAGTARLWRWASAAAMLLVLVVAGFWLLRETGSRASMADRIPPPDRFELDYIRVGGQPANAYVYQPQGTDMIIVWAEKTP